MATEVTLPQLGESVTEGTITAWLVQVGDHVEADQPLFELSSDKIDTEVPAPTSGVLSEIKVGVDETVDVGTVVAVIAAEDEASADGGGAEPQAPAAQEQEAPEREAPAQEAPAEVEEAGTEAQGEGTQAAGTVQEREEIAREDLADSQPEAAQPEAAQEPEPQPQPKSEPTGQPAATGTYERSEGEVPSPAEVGGSQQQGDGRGRGVLASPIVRRMVADAGLDITSITPSGEGGRVTREDVEAAIAKGGDTGTAQAEQPAPAPARQEQPAPAAQRAPAPSTPQVQQAQPSVRPQPERTVSLDAGERERVEDLSRIRQRIAAKMMESLQSSAQLTTVQEADMTRVMRIRERLKDEFKSREGVSLSPFVFLCRAAVLTLRRPEFERANAQADWQAGKVKFHDYVNLGIAVDTEKGLLVPNIKNADDLTLAALARAINEQASKARGKGQLEIRDIEGGTFTVTNTGSRGVLIDTPILNYPEVAILGTGAIKRRPIVVTDGDGVESISVRDMIYLSMTYDHRLLDGADAARFVTTVKEVVETHDWEQEIGY